MEKFAIQVTSTRKMVIIKKESNTFVQLKNIEQFDNFMPID